MHCFPLSFACTLTPTPTRAHSHTHRHTNTHTHPLKHTTAEHSLTLSFILKRYELHIHTLTLTHTRAHILSLPYFFLPLSLTSLHFCDLVPYSNSGNFFQTTHPLPITHKSSFSFSLSLLHFCHPPPHTHSHNHSPHLQAHA